MKTKILFVILFSFIFSNTFSQSQTSKEYTKKKPLSAKPRVKHSKTLTNESFPDWDWEKTAGGSSDNIALCVKTDRLGNVYLLEYGGVITIAGHIIPDYGLNLIKFDNHGNVVWHKNSNAYLANYSSKYGTRLATDKDDNIYIAVGTYEFSPYFTFGNDSIQCDPQGGWETYLTKFDKNGQVKWIKGMHGNGAEFPEGLTNDKLGNIYITGNFTSDTLFIDNQVLLNSSDIDTNDIFIAKYDSLGILQWAKREGGKYQDYASGIACDTNNNIYITGYFRGITTIINSSTVNNSSNTPQSNDDSFVLKYTQAGTFVYIKKLLGNGDERITDVLVYPDNSVQFAGVVTWNVSLGSIALNALNGSNSTRVFTYKINSAGTVIWGKSPTEIDNWVNSLAIDSAGNLYIDIRYSPLVFNFAGQTLYNTSAGSFDESILKFDSNGNSIWSIGYGGPGDDKASEITCDREGNIYLTGTYTGAIQFGNAAYQNMGGKDLFVAKLIQTGASNNSPVCYGDTLNLFGPTYNNASYHWIGPNGFSSNLQSPTIINAIDTVDAGMYVLYVVQNTDTIFTDSTDVLVHGPLAAPILTSNSPVCPGSPLYLFNSEDPNCTYYWNLPNGLQYVWDYWTNFTINESATPAMSGVYTMQHQKFGCFSSIASTTVIVNDSVCPRDIGAICLDPSVVDINGDVQIYGDIKNFGLSPVTSFNGYALIDGVDQVNNHWTGNLLPGDTLKNFLFGTVTLTGQNHSAKLWTSMPNTVPDMNFTNDTISGNFTLSLNDAGVTQLKTPLSTIVSDVDIYADFKNFGLAALTGINLVLKVNGSIQNTTPWSGNLASGAIEDSIFFGTAHLNHGLNDISLWTDSPNSVPDDDLNNDTLKCKIFYCIPMGGAYIIGASPSDFSTIQGAIDTLAIACLTGPVVLNIKPGIYTEDLIIPELPGVDSINTVTINSLANDSTSVEIFPFNATSTLQILGADHLTIENITLHAGTVSAVYYTNHSDYNTFKNNVFISAPVTSYNTINTYLVYSPLMSNSQDKFNVFENNRFENSGNGIWLESYNWDYEEGNKIIGNIFNDQSYDPIYVITQRSIEIANNMIFNNHIHAKYYDAISLNISVDSNRIYNNSIYCQTDTIISNYDGIYLNGIWPTYPQKTEVYNNMINLNMESIAENISGVFKDGISIQDVNNTLIMHNSVYISGNDSNTIALNCFWGDSIEVKNNIFCNDAGGLAYFFHADSATSVDFDGLYDPDYNSLYSNARIANAGDEEIITVEDLFTNLNTDENSIFHFPDFVSLMDLHIMHDTAIIAKGTPSFVHYDIDGELRGNPPDIGADEYNGPFSINNIHDPGDIISIFPNPASDQLNIKLSSGYLDQNLKLELYSISGQLIFSTQITSVDSHIKVSDLAQGVYVIKISSKTEVTVKRFIRN